MSSPEQSGQGCSWRHQARSQKVQLDVSLELAYSCPGPLPSCGSELASTFLPWDAACLPITGPFPCRALGTQQPGLGVPGPSESQKAREGCGLSSPLRPQQRPSGGGGLARGLAKTLGIGASL